MQTDKEKMTNRGKKERKRREEGESSQPNTHAPELLDQEQKFPQKTAATLNMEKEPKSPLIPRNSHIYTNILRKREVVGPGRSENVELFSLENMILCSVIIFIKSIHGNH